MSTETDIDAIIAEVDALAEAGEDAKAEEMLIAAIARYTESNPDQIVGQGVLFNELGGFYRSRGIFGKGEEAFLKAKALFETIRGYAYTVAGPAPASGCCAYGAPAYGGSCCGDGNEQQSHTEIIYTSLSTTANYATTLNNLAGLYRMSGQLPKAIETFDAAIAVYEGCSGDVSPDAFASVYSNKGLVYLDMQDADRAKAMFRRAREILEAGGSYPFAMGTTVSNLGFASVLEQKGAEAIACFKEAKALFEEAGSREMVQNCEAMISRLEAGR